MIFKPKVEVHSKVKRGGPSKEQSSVNINEDHVTGNRSFVVKKVNVVVQCRAASSAALRSGSPCCVHEYHLRFELVVHVVMTPPYGQTRKIVLNLSFSWTSSVRKSQ